MRILPRRSRAGALGGLLVAAAAGAFGTVAAVSSNPEFINKLWKAIGWPRDGCDLSASARKKWADRQHITSVKQLSRTCLDELLKVAEWMEDQLKAGKKLDICKGDVLACLFYEPSTRTMSSFVAAMQRLGGSVIPISDVKNSSVSKGETLEDTIRCLTSYCNAIALRHKEIGSADRAASVAGRASILNAGDGAGEHPTQALLDLYTIKKEQGRLENLNILLVGDLKHGRTVHSLAKLLTNFSGITITYVSPASLKIPKVVREYVTTAGPSVVQKETESLLEAIKEADVLYMTRIQKERFADPKMYDEVKDAFELTADLLKTSGAKSNLTIMHPLPRVNEISTDVDEDTDRAAYFRQMKNGLYVRMALLALLTGKDF